MPRAKKTSDSTEPVKKPRKAAKTGKTSVSRTPKQVPTQDTPLIPQINIGLVGHVDHGKTTLTRALSGTWTDTHSEEIKRGITIRLGYADATFYKDKEGHYTPAKKDKDGKENTPVRTVSFVDAPGHETLMATMLAGSNIMDGALLLISANELCPQPQTREHLTALEIMGITNIVIVQNKIDLVSPEEAKENHEQIRAFVKGTIAEGAPIIPISAIHLVNLDALINAIETVIPTPSRSDKEQLIIHTARSFDINKPGTDPAKMLGGVLGGAVVSGTLHVGEEIEIRPGRRVEFEGKVTYKPLTTKVTGLKIGGRNVEAISPGGSIGIMTDLDPAIVKSDALTGSLIGRVGQLPPVWSEFALEVHLLKRVVGAKDELLVDPLRFQEKLMLNVNSAATVGVVLELKKKTAFCRLMLPVCAEVGSRVTISRMIGNRWRLIGYGIIRQ